MKVSKKNKSWGTVYFYDGEDYGFTLHVYMDDKEAMILANVKVNEDKRGTGLGNKILEMAKREASAYKAKELYLKCNINDWTHDWYKRHDFEDYIMQEDSKDLMWMICKINNEDNGN